MTHLLTYFVSTAYHYLNYQITIYPYLTIIIISPQFVDNYKTAGRFVKSERFKLHFLDSQRDDMIREIRIPPEDINRLIIETTSVDNER